MQNLYEEKIKKKKKYVFHKKPLNFSRDCPKQSEF